MIVCMTFKAQTFRCRCNTNATCKYHCPKSKKGKHFRFFVCTNSFPSSWQLHSNLEHPAFIFQKIWNKGGQEILKRSQINFWKFFASEWKSFSFSLLFAPSTTTFYISLCFVFDLLVQVRKHHPPNCEHLHSCRCEGKHLIEWVREVSADLQY